MSNWALVTHSRTNEHQALQSERDANFAKQHLAEIQADSDRRKQHLDAKLAAKREARASKSKSKKARRYEVPVTGSIMVSAADADEAHNIVHEIVFKLQSEKAQMPVFEGVGVYLRVGKAKYSYEYQGAPVTDAVLETVLVTNE